MIECFRIAKIDMPIIVYNFSVDSNYWRLYKVQECGNSFLFLILLKK